MKENNKKRASVLVVDDDMTIRLLAHESLEQWGFIVEEAENGIQGISVFERIQPDIVLLDVLMPEMDGYTTCVKLRELQKDNPKPVLMMTGLDDIESINRAFEVGASDFITKPINWVILGHRVRYMLRAHQAIDELRKREVRFAQAQKLEAIGQLAAGIAHEINTPTQFIGDNLYFLQEAFHDLNRLLDKNGMFLETNKKGIISHELIHEIETLTKDLNLDYLVDEIPKAIQQSLDGNKSVSKIVCAMKNFSHPGTEEKMAIDINSIIENTITVTRNEWKYLADIVTDFETSLPPVFCLPGEFSQVILNLIINAVHAITDVEGKNSKGKGVIKISTSRDDDWVEVRIADTGPGIPESVRHKIFDPFFTTKEVGKGTGQGLAISYDVIVKKHDGTIHFDTKLGEGTTFTIRLPINVKVKLESR